jgi:hypothetical protein
MGGAIGEVVGRVKGRSLGDFEQSLGHAWEVS